MTLLAWLIPVLLNEYGDIRGPSESDMQQLEEGVAAPRKRKPTPESIRVPGLELTEGDTLLRPEPPRQAEERWVAGINAFGIAAFRKAASAAPEGNLVLSPYALALGHNLVANGSSPEEAAGIRALLGQDSLDPREVDRFHAATLGHLLDSTRGVYARFAQALWSRNSPRDSALLAVQGPAYRAGREVLDPKSADLAERVDGWTYRTSGSWVQPYPLGSARPGTAGLLTQSVVIHGYWQETRPSRNDTFTRPGGSTVTVRMLGLQAPIAQVDRVSLIALPFAGEDHDLVLILPDSGRAVNAVISGMTGEDWRVWMGIRPLFRGYGIFPALSLGHAERRDSYLPGRALLQGVFVKIGTTKHRYLYPQAERVKHWAGMKPYGKATVIHRRGGGADPDPAVEFRADRPFLFAIRDRRTGLLLMLGRMIDPSAR